MGGGALSDPKLVERAIRGDHRAYEVLIENLAPVILFRVRKHLSKRNALRPELEKDLVRNTMLRLLANGAEQLGRCETSLEVWVSLVVDSVILSQFARTSQDDSEPAETAPAKIDVDNLDRDFLDRLLSRILERLPRPDLNLFWSLYVEGREAEDVARELNLNDTHALRDAMKSLVGRVIREARRITA